MPWLFSGVFVMAALLGSAVEPYSAAHPAVYAGTYAVRICHGSCAGPSATPFRIGTIVLFDRPLQDQHGHTFRSDLDRDPSNACFVLNHTRASSDQDGYIPPQGFFSWALRQNVVALQLERDADGGYGVSLHLTPRGLGGTGRIWGGAVVAMTPDSPQVPPDHISAVRVGEPDVAKCPTLPGASR